MAPVVEYNDSPEGGSGATVMKPASATESDRKKPSSSTETQNRKTSKASIKKPKCPSKKKTAPAPQSQTRNRKKKDQDYERMMNTRRLFGDNTPAGGSASQALTSTGDPAYSAKIEKYMDNRPSVEEEVMKAERAMIDNAHERCGEKADSAFRQDGLYGIRGVTTPLTPIQFATLGWMIKREAIKSSKGGIVAHTMGLGKTLMALSLMVINSTGLQRRKAADCSTLVVVPNDAILTHWQEECVKHASGVLKAESMARYKDLKSLKKIDAFKDYDIVFATYGELSTEIPDFYKEAKDPKKPLNPEVSEKIENHKWAAVFEAKWFRVILDEAHTIKNKNSKASLSVRRLQKRCAWMITGTPLSNKTEEMFPYFNFLGIEKSMYLSTFTEKYFPERKASPAFRGQLADVMIRRQIGETFLGEDIISLPSHHALTKILLPSSKERVILDFLKTKIRETAVKTYNEALESAETVNAARIKAYSSVTTLLHLYRYASIHPFLLENAFMTTFSVEDVEQLIGELEKADEKAGENEKTNSPNFSPIQEIVKVALQHRDLGGKSCANCNQECDVVPGLVYTIPCGHFLCFRCVSYGPDLPPGAERLQRCADEGCSRKFLYPSGTECPPSLYHPKFLKADPLASDSDSEDARPPPMKASRKGKGKGRQLAMEPPPIRLPGCDEHGNEPPLNNDKRRFLAFADTYLKKSRRVVPSAKIEGAQKLIREWQETAPDDKIIIFTQFMVVAKLVGRIAYLEKKKFLYYTGDMSANARKLALTKFKTDKSVKILVASLRCGGQGIDITSANRVILMEPWWNSPAEDQAFSRSYRMGQEKEVHVVRFICSGTKEDDIAELQRKKETELSDCLMSRKATKTKQSLLSLLTLMGLPIEDEDGAVTGLRKPEEEEEEEEEAVFTEDEDGYEKHEEGMGNGEEGDEWGDEVEKDEDAGKEKGGKPGGGDEGVKKGPNGSREENGEKDGNGNDTMGKAKKVVEKVEKHKNAVENAEEKSKDRGEETQGAGTGKNGGMNQEEHRGKDGGFTTEKSRKIDEKPEKNIAGNEEKETEEQQKETGKGKEGEKKGDNGSGERDEKDEDGDTIMG